MFCIKILDKNWNTISVARGEEEVNLVLAHTYQEGDKLIFESGEKSIFIWLQFDDAIGSSLVYLQENNFSYEIPFGEKRINLSPKSFSGDKHLIRIKKAKDFEVNQYRNLSFNVVDHHSNTFYYPHINANVETRGEAVFAAQNAIDGIVANSSHGEWPFQSWGINRQDDAKIKIDFGRKVKVDRIIVYNRADFPHDNWWKSGEVMFSDGSILNLEMTKTEKAQEFVFEEKTITWLEYGKLIKSEEPSPFPALSQIEVYGMEDSSI